MLGSFLTTDVRHKSPYRTLCTGNDLKFVMMNSDIRVHLQQLINQCKAGGTSERLQDEFFDLLEDEFLTGGVCADYIVLGCTELPLLLADDKRMELENLGVNVIDPNAVLAKTLLQFGNYWNDDMEL